MLWSSARITNYWATALGVCLTREHADINCRLARGDFDRRHQGFLLSDTFAGGAA